MNRFFNCLRLNNFKTISINYTNWFKFYAKSEKALTITIQLIRL